MSSGFLVFRCEGGVSILEASSMAMAGTVLQRRARSVPGTRLCPGPVPRSSKELTVHLERRGKVALAGPLPEAP